MALLQRVTIFFSVLLAIPSHGQLAAPGQYTSNDYATAKAESLDDEYYFTYGFKDLNGAYQEFKWNFDKYKTDNYIYGFGLAGARDPNQITAEDDEARAGKMFFNESRQTFEFNYSEIVASSREIVYPLYLQFKAISKKYSLKQRDQLELILRFLQDVPYGVPPDNLNDRFIGGLFPPSETFKHGWGDCDSKSLIMAAVLGIDPLFQDRLAVIQVPGHILLGINYPPSPYDKTIKYLAKEYIYAEPVGPKRTSLGVTNSPYSSGARVIPLRLPPYTQSISHATTLITSSETKVDISQESCPDDGLKIKYDLKWDKKKVVSCQIKKDGKFVKHGPTYTFDLSGTLLSKEIYKFGEKL